MTINARSIIKGAAKFIGSMGVGALVTIGVKQNIIPSNKYEKIMTVIGSFVLSDMISSMAEEYIDKQCDSMFGTVDEVKSLISESSEKQTNNEMTKEEAIKIAIEKIQTSQKESAESINPDTFKEHTDKIQDEIDKGLVDLFKNSDE